jgi:hypothetical protein
LPDILVIKNKVEDSLGIYTKQKSGAYTKFGVQIAPIEKASNHLRFLNVIFVRF